MALRAPDQFIRVDAAIDENEKIAELSDPAFRLLINTWAWCKRRKNNGAIKDPVWAKRGTAKARRELLAAGLAEQCDGHVLMHDYLDWQVSVEEQCEIRDKRAEAGSKGGKAKASAVANARALAKQEPEQVSSNGSSKHLADIDIDEDIDKNSLPRKRGRRLPEDWKPSVDDVAWQRGEGIDDTLARRELPKFCDYWHAKAGAAATKLDWSLTWRNWLRTAVERQPQGPADVARARVAARQANPLASAL